MHNKIKGNIGQFETASFLAKHGFSIFTEEGDISKIDLIAENEGKLIRFQCKSYTPVNHTLNLSLTKSGPHYRFSYNSSMFDWFSVYDLINDKLYFIPVSILTTHKKSVKLRLNECRQKDSHKASDFLADKQIFLLS